MKILILFFVSLIPVFSQTPNCKINFQFTGSGQVSVNGDNRSLGCTYWSVTYTVSGFSAISMIFQSTTGTTGPGSWGNYSGTVTGTNPMTAVPSGSLIGNGFVTWYRVNLTSVTGATGLVTGVINGYVNSSAGPPGPTGPAGAAGANGTNGAIAEIQGNGTAAPVEPDLNFIAGTNTTVTVTDDPTHTRTNVAINSTGGGGGGSVPTSGWTMQNATNADMVFTNFSGGTVAIGGQAIDTQDAGMITQTLPGATFTITATLNCITPNVQLNSSLCGLGLFDGTNAETIEILQEGAAIGQSLRVSTWTNLHVGTITVINGPTNEVVMGQPTFRVTDNGTTRLWQYYSNGVFTTFLSEATNTFLTPTSAGPMMFCDVAGIEGNAAYCTEQVMQWSATTP